MYKTDNSLCEAFESNRIFPFIQGRAMFATKSFEAGETIFEEKPFVSSQFAWNKSYKYLACENCLK